MTQPPNRCSACQKPLSDEEVAVAVAVPEIKTIYLACSNRECIDAVMAHAPEEERLAAEPWLSRPPWM